MYLNKVTLIGNLTKDPELKALPNGQSVVNFSLATNRVWKDAQGAKKEDVEFHNIVVFGKQANTIKQYCKKGDGLLVEGRIQTRTWENDGKKYYRTEIIGESFQFGQKSKKLEVDDETGEKIPDEIINREEVDVTHKTHDPETGQDISLEDIPF